MKLTIAQILLEGAQFAHKSNYLERMPTEATAASPVDLQIELAEAQDKPNARVVRLRVMSNAPEALYEFTVSYLAIFTLDMEGEQPPADLDRRLMVTGATMVFPFAREVVANLTMRGRFGPSWMQPVNINELVLGNTPPQPVVAANVVNVTKKGSQRRSKR
jgi:preprotein translocase subunit SecB